MKAFGPKGSRWDLLHTVQERLRVFTDRAGRRGDKSDFFHQICLDVHQDRAKTSILGLTSKWQRKHLLPISPSLTIHIQLKVSSQTFSGPD